jgi:anti-sigma B factor antagonist
MAPTRFSVAVAHLDGHMLVTVRGEIDADTAPQFTDALDIAVRLPSPMLIIDMSAVSFIDAAACYALVRTCEHAERAGMGLQLRGITPSGRHVLEVAQLDDLFTFIPAADGDGSGS